MATKLSDLLRAADHPGYAIDAEALESALAAKQTELDAALERVRELVAKLSGGK